MRGHLPLRSMLRWLVLLSLLSAACGATPDTPAASSLTPGVITLPGTEEPQPQIVAVLQTADFFPSDEAVTLEIAVPPSVDGQVVPPPDRATVLNTRPPLLEAMAKSGLDPKGFDLDLTTAGPEASFYAAPTLESFSTRTEDVVVGLYWVVGNQAAYTVKVSGEQAVLSNRDGSLPPRDLKVADRPKADTRTLAFFVEGSCWVCFNFDGRAICFGC